MIHHHLSLAGEPCTVHELEPRNAGDVEAFREWYETRPLLAVDTETTGVDLFAPDWRLRLVQVGDARDAFVLPVEADPRLLDVVRDALKRPEALLLHNATFDLLALERAGAAVLEDLYPRTLDTRTMAHLLDPRAPQEGGTGHGLKGLSDLLVDPASSSIGKDALQALFRAEGWGSMNAPNARGWAMVPLDAPAYVIYSGLDALLTARLHRVLSPEVAARGFSRLLTFERQVAMVCAQMERAGLLVDRDYVEGSLLPYLEQMGEEGAREAAAFGVENVNAPAQVARALQALGVELLEVTEKSGAPKVDKAVLDALVLQGNPLAAAVQKAKRAGKWLSSYVEPMLWGTDAQGRIHPTINPLQARTARMSIASPPLQQLPSGDWRIRRAIVADPGRSIWSADYEQVEMRVLAALAREPKMLAAIAAGTDLHDATAALMFGPDFTKEQRKLAKTAGFGKVYGGGKATLARQTGTTLEAAKRVVDAYDAAYPGIKRYQRRLQDRALAGGRREVVTPSGRHLPLDGDRLYAATNYVVQSTARDVLCQALLDLVEAGVRPGDHLLLPIHDEFLGQTTAAEWDDLQALVGRTMSMDFLGVRLDAAADLYGPSWGAGYGAPE